MISSIFKVSLIAVLLCAPAGTAAAEGQWGSAETQSAWVPSWMWHSFKQYKKEPHYRALACVEGTQGSHCSWTYGRPTAEYAVERVMEVCKEQASRRGIFAPCRLRYIGDIDVYLLKGAKLEHAIRVYQQNPDATKKDLEKQVTPPPIG